MTTIWGRVKEVPSLPQASILNLDPREGIIQMETLYSTLTKDAVSLGCKAVGTTLGCKSGHTALFPLSLTLSTSMPHADS